MCTIEGPHNNVELLTSWTCSSSPSAPPDTVKNNFLSPPPPPILANSMLLSASVTAYANKYYPACLIWFGLSASSRFSGYSGATPDDSDCHNYHFASHGVYLKLPASYCESVFSATVMESTKPSFHRLVAVGCGRLCSGKDDWEIKFAESVDGTRSVSSERNNPLFCSTHFLATLDPNRLPMTSLHSDECDGHLLSYTSSDVQEVAY